MQVRSMSNWLPQRLGHQLYLLASLSMCLSFALFGVFAVREQSSQALAAMEQQAKSVARDLALLSEPLILADKLDDLEVLLKNVMELPEILEVRVMDAEGMAVSHLRRDVGQAPHAVFGSLTARVSLPASPKPLLVHDESLQGLVAWQPIVSGTLLGWVRVDHGTQALITLRERILISSAVAGLLACLVSVALLRALLRRPLRSLGQAQSFASGLQRIEGQQLDRIEGPLETRDLAQALNQASARLFEQRCTIDASLIRLQEQEAALARTNEQLRTIFALSPDALLSIDDTGRASFANAAFFQMTGLSNQAVLGQKWEDLDEALSRLAADGAALPPLARLMAGPQTEPLRMVLSRPRVSVLEFLAREGQTSTVSWLFYMRDITRETEVDRMKSEFLSTAAHELRTPMTGIYSCVELMTTRDMPAHRQKDLLGIVSRQSRAMMTIVNELLDISRLEARGSEDFCLETLPLVDAVGRALADFVPPAERLKPELELGDDIGRHSVCVDPAKLGQVVANLLSNAYKYSSSGPVRVRYLPPRPSAQGAEIGFEVEDHGIGMTAEQLARVTERFYRADASGHVLGTGLGMSIVENIVSLLGGRLELRSELGSGTAVCVWLPLVCVNADEQALAPALEVEPAS